MTVNTQKKAWVTEMHKTLDDGTIFVSFKFYGAGAFCKAHEWLDDYPEVRKKQGILWMRVLDDIRMIKLGVLPNTDIAELHRNFLGAYTDPW